MKLCGISLYNQGIAQFEQDLRKNADTGQLSLISTPNPEMCLEALKDPNFAQTLQACTFRIPDGFGLTLMSQLLGQGAVERVSGVDVLPIIAKIAAQKQWTLIMIGGNQPAGSNSCDKAAEVFKQQNPNLRITTFPEIPMQANDTPDVIAQTLSMSEPCVIMVGLGMNKQETWMTQQAATFPDVKIAIGCGGAFSMIAGTLPRAPRLMRQVGLEWLWRLILEPSRIKRIFHAVVIFPIRATLYALRNSQ